MRGAFTAARSDAAEPRERKARAETPHEWDTDQSDASDVLTVSTSRCLEWRGSRVMVNVWRLMAHNDECCHLPMIQWAKDNNRIALGWGLIGDIRHFATPQDIADAACRTGSPYYQTTKTKCATSCWNFYEGPKEGPARYFYPSALGAPDNSCNTMQCDDLVILKTRIGPRGGFRNSVVMRVTGPYEYIAPPQALPCLADYEYQNQREAEVTDICPEALWHQVRPILPGQNKFNALVRCHAVGQAVVNGLARNRHLGQRVT